MSSHLTFREVRTLLRLGQQEMAKKLGISRPYLSEIENGRRQPSETLAHKLADLKAHATGAIGSEVRLNAGRGIPVISWARAGIAASYEDIPFDWQESILSDCPDEHAFGLILEGDSMEPKYSAGDVVVLMPTRQPRLNQLVGANIREQGVVFKIFTVLNEPRRIRLSSYNSAVYPPVEFQESDFEWIYPAYEARRRLWRL